MKELPYYLNEKGCKCTGKCDRDGKITVVDCVCDARSNRRLEKAC